MLTSGKFHVGVANRAGVPPLEGRHVSPDHLFTAMGAVCSPILAE
jgi:hypothetical protein